MNFIPTLPIRESERTEFMARFDLKRSVRTIVTFLNAQGGALYIGIDDLGKIVGLPDPEAVTLQLRDAFASEVWPTYPAAVRIEKASETRYVVVEVPPGPEPPYAFEGQFLVRVGTHTRPGSPQDLTQLLGLRKERALRWERQPALNLEIADLDAKEIQRTATEAKHGRLARIAGTESIEDVLRAFNLLDGGRPTHAAAILFAKNPARFYPQTRIRAARFSDDDASEFIDNRVFEGHVFHLFDAVRGFFAEHIPISSRFIGGNYRRSDRPAYPPFALREALMNALVHRDYAAFNGGLSVSLYPNRLEVWNSGKLPEGITPSNLKTLRISRPHNPDMAHVLFLRGLIERWGIGTRRIVEECQAAGLPDPRWEEIGGGIRLTLFLRHAESSILEEINERMKALLSILSGEETITSSDYAERFAIGLSERSARTDLGRLVEMGFLVREGAGRTTRYRRTEIDLPE